MIKSPQVVLIAEDDEDDIDLFLEVLETFEPEKIIKVGHNGIELLKCLNESMDKPSIIFLDINMPKMNGIECLKNIRENEKFKNIPVIILTTSASEESVESARKLGADNFLVKQNDFLKFKSIIERIFQADYSQPTHPDEFFIK